MDINAYSLIYNHGIHKKETFSEKRLVTLNMLIGM